MNCLQCGFNNADDASFCRQCGAAIDAGPLPPQAPPALPKKRTGLVVGLAAIGVVLIAAAVALYVFVLGGTPVTGRWYCAERGWVLSFEDGEALEKYSLAGTAKGVYAYDKGKAQGRIALAGGTPVLFRISDGKLVLSEDGGPVEFARLDAKADAGQYVRKALEGVWASEELGEVLRLKDGKLLATTLNGDEKGTYKYDVEKGGGVITLNGTEYAFGATHEALSIPDTGVYSRAANDLDIAAFLDEFASPLLGVWYESTGVFGTITFYAGGSLEIVSFGTACSGTYTFDAAQGAGLILVQGETTAFSQAGGIIEADGHTYTREYVTQLGAGGQDAPTGTWYETTGRYGTLSFYDDGGIEANMYGEISFGSYTYNPLEGAGEISLEYGGEVSITAFALAGETLTTGEAVYTRSYVKQMATVIGTWYDMQGEAGTVNFYGDGVFIRDTYGLTISGTYSFDPERLEGVMDMQLGDGPYSITFYLEGGVLALDGPLYARDYVPQPYYAEPVAG